MCGRCPSEKHEPETDTNEEKHNVKSDPETDKEETGAIKNEEVASENVATETVKLDSISLTADAVGKINEAQKVESRTTIPWPSDSCCCVAVVCSLLLLIGWYMSSGSKKETQAAPPRRVAIQQKYDVQQTTSNALKQLGQSSEYSKYLKVKKSHIMQEVDANARRCRQFAFTGGAIYLAACYYFVQPPATFRSMSNFSLVLAAVPFFLPMLKKEQPGLFWSCFLSTMALGYTTNASKVVGVGCLYAVTASALFIPALSFYQTESQRTKMNYLKLLQNPTEPPSKCKCC